MARAFYTSSVLGLVIGCVCGCGRPEATYERSGTPAVSLEFRRASDEPVVGWTAIDADAFEQLLSADVAGFVELANGVFESSPNKQVGFGGIALIRCEDRGQ